MTKLEQPITLSAFSSFSVSQIIQDLDTESITLIVKCFDENDYLITSASCCLNKTENKEILATGIRVINGVVKSVPVKVSPELIDIINKLSGQELRNDLENYLLKYGIISVESQ